MKAQSHKNTTYHIRKQKIYFLPSLGNSLQYIQTYHTNNSSSTGIAFPIGSIHSINDAPRFAEHIKSYKGKRENSTTTNNEGAGVYANLSVQRNRNVFTESSSSPGGINLAIQCIYRHVPHASPYMPSPHIFKMREISLPQIVGKKKKGKDKTNEIFFLDYTSC